ncbi:2-hydroxyacid dehydrogenase [Rhizosphaericola mali]|uniref:Glyoxylate/hydroxypyruvate reductase B n=1 Tax=Rhizosphaericola mali TaxID=2545455 RepID=A0A5P2G5L6_9BACT|nr:D-glycerate dehydrogenase [Rhizosphaericola mali]QES90825.1 D-glycerate dehydrogenase [Rhizosphaericola mali]
MKVFVTRNLPEKGIKILESKGIKLTIWKKKEHLSTPDLIEKLKGFDGLICVGPYKIDENFLSQVGHLNVISLLSVGFDNVDVDAAKKAQMPIGNTPGVLSKATADTAFLLMQMTARKAIYNYNRIVNSDWGFYDPTAYLGQDLEGKTLGVFGLGRIGMEMANRCKNAFGMKVIYHNRKKNEEAEKELGAKKVSFNKLLKDSDVLTLHAALTPATTGLFGTEQFELMKPTSILVNTARGAMVDEKALIQALKKKTIWGAGLDVTHPEPMDAKNPLLFMENVAVLPHIGSATEDTRNEMARLAAENILAGLKGEKLPYSIY